MTLATDQILSCPNCRHAIKLTESLAAPLVAATRADYERRLAAQTEAVAAEKLVLSAQQQANERRTAELAAAAESSAVTYSNTSATRPASFAARSYGNRSAREPGPMVGSQN